MAAQRKTNDRHMELGQSCRKHVGESTCCVVGTGDERRNTLKRLPLVTVVLFSCLEAALAFQVPLAPSSLALSLSSNARCNLLPMHQRGPVRREKEGRHDPFRFQTSHNKCTSRYEASSMPRMCSESKQDVADDVGFGDYIKQLPSRLVEHLQTSTGDQDAREQTRRYIIELEQLQNYPLDPSFHNFAVAGEWQLLYSTSRISAPDTNLKLRSIRSKWDAKNGNIVHDVAWDFKEEDDYLTSGTFQVISNFSYGETPSMPARSHVAVDALELTPRPLNRPPKDPQALISALQRALPKEYFDPDGAVLDTTYLDPSLRIVCFLGMRFAGVRHVYSRILPPGASPPSAVDP